MRKRIKFIDFRVYANYDYYKEGDNTKTINTDIFDNYMKENNLSKSGFCKNCNINYSTLQKMYNENNKFGIKALFKIARVIKLNICVILNR